MYKYTYSIWIYAIKQNTVHSIKSLTVHSTYCKLKNWLDYKVSEIAKLCYFTKLHLSYEPIEYFLT